MEIIETPLKDCFIIKSKKFGDDRGFFLEALNQKHLKNAGIDLNVQQINFAKSGKNVLRGLHYQLEPMAQAKYVGVISGAAVDVAVDIRESSPTFGQYFMAELSSPDTLFYVPRGFAHGYYTLEENTIFYYAVDNFYSPEHERGILYNDPDLGINWGDIEPLVSEKDLKQSKFKSAELFR